MASSWWASWPFGKGASSLHPANFLHLSKANVETICQLTSNEVPLNPHQCKSMSVKLRRTMQSIENIVGSLDDINLVCGSVALENFYRVSEKAKQLVKKCCSVDWYQESAFQIQNEEAFKEILLETSFSYHTILGLLEDLNSDHKIDFIFQYSTFNPPSADEVFSDRIALHNRLEGLVNAKNISFSDIQSQHLRKYLLGRVNFALDQSNDKDFDVRSFNLWSDGKGPDGEWSKESEPLGGNVSKTTWLGVPCAKKLFIDAMQEDEWSAEAKILASLNHPNIVKFLCSNKYETIHTRGHFIAMEHMETSLGSFIRRLKDGGSKFSLFPALDVILQIAYGMCYVHEHGIAHRDLKTSNVVVRRINAPHLEGYLEVKIVDFGISKAKLSKHKSNTITRPRIGTTSYMPPEAFSNGRANWFKADVYSFSVMCSVILSGEEPFQNRMRGDLYEAICRGDRPKLPADTPKELASLIMEGWAMDTALRPSFMDICTRLEKLRHHLLRNHSSGLSWKEADEDSITGFIFGMLEYRSMARELEYSHSALQRAVKLFDEEEWFDGEELSGSQQSGNSSQVAGTQPSGTSYQTVSTPAGQIPQDFQVSESPNAPLTASSEVVRKKQHNHGIAETQLNMDNSWRASIPHDYRQILVKRIMDRLLFHLPIAGQDGRDEVRKIAWRYENEIFQIATDLHDYLRRFRLKMLTIERRGRVIEVQIEAPSVSPAQFI